MKWTATDLPKLRRDLIKFLIEFGPGIYGGHIENGKQYVHPVGMKHLPFSSDREDPETSARSRGSVTLRHAVTDPHVDLRILVMEHVQHHHERTVSIGRSREGRIKAPNVHAPDAARVAPLS